MSEPIGVPVSVAPIRLGATAQRTGRPAGSIPALLALYVCWGSSVPAMKVMVDTIPPLAGAGGVFTLGGIILLLTGRARAPRAEMRRAAVAGAVLLAGGQGIATVALTTMTASLTAIFVATIPLAVAALGWATGARGTRRTGACLATGFAGVTLVVLSAPSAALGGSVAGVVLTVVAVACWATGTHLAARGGLPADPRVAGGTQLMTAACCCSASPR